jgi:hypothetical protein
MASSVVRMPTTLSGSMGFAQTPSKPPARNSA